MANFGYLSLVHAVWRWRIKFLMILEPSHFSLTIPHHQTITILFTFDGKPEMWDDISRTGAPATCVWPYVHTSEQQSACSFYMYMHDTKPRFQWRSNSEISVICLVRHFYNSPITTAFSPFLLFDIQKCKKNPFKPIFHLIMSSTTSKWIYIETSRVITVASDECT